VEFKFLKLEKKFTASSFLLMGVFLFLFLLFGLLGLWGRRILFSCDFPYIVGGRVFNVLFYLDPLAFLFLRVLFRVVACV
jgi:hypothetical protein